MGVSSDTFLVSIVTKYYPDMKRLFVFVKSLCSICCSEMCGSIMSYCTTGQTGVRTVQHHRSIVTVLQETVGTVVPTQWQSPDNVSRFWLSHGPDIDRTMFLDFLLSQGLDIRRTIFQGLDRHRTFCQWISIRTQMTSILTSSSSDALIIQTGRYTHQICWWTDISTNLSKIFSRNSKDLNLDVSHTGRTRWLTGRFRWTQQISWWIYSSHALFDRFSILIIGVFFQ